MDDQSLIQQINNTPFISPADKAFLIEKLSQIDENEKLQLKSSLLAGQAPPILRYLQSIRIKFYQNEQNYRKPKQTIVEKLGEFFVGSKPKKLLSASILTQPNLIGGAVVQSTKEKAEPLKSLDSISHPSQLSVITSQHINFTLDTNSEQIVQKFMQATTRMFGSMPIQTKRSYLVNFIESPLFISYMNTGLTAMRHDELEPRKVALNLLHQINPSYLNNRQFETASVICRHIRSLASI
jgi:hypothetical protein